jgi:hypothetical protein
VNDPRYSFHNDSQALSVIAENTRRCAETLEKIRSILFTALTLAIGLGIGYQVKHHGWRSLFGDWF